MILFTTGCSFTYGEELEDKNKAWPYMLGKLFNAEKVINKGICSGSNDYIIRTTMEFISECIEKNINFKDIIIVNGFTSEIRKECYSDYYEKFVQIKLGREMAIVDEKEPKIIPFKIIKGNIKDIYDNIIKSYLVNFESNYYYNLILKMNQMILLENYLNSLNIKHLFFNSLSEKFNKKEINENFIFNNYKKTKLLFDYTFNDNNNIITDITMQTFCNNRFVPLGPLMHPLEKGHKLWAEYLFERLKNE